MSGIIGTGGRKYGRGYYGVQAYGYGPPFTYPWFPDEVPDEPWIPDVAPGEPWEPAPPIGEPWVPAAPVGGLWVQASNPAGWNG